MGDISFQMASKTDLALALMCNRLFLIIGQQTVGRIVFFLIAKQAVSQIGQQAVAHLPPFR